MSEEPQHRFVGTIDRVRKGQGFFLGPRGLDLPVERTYTWWVLAVAFFATEMALIHAIGVSFNPIRDPGLSALATELTNRAISTERPLSGILNGLFQRVRVRNHRRPPTVSRTRPQLSGSRRRKS